MDIQNVSAVLPDYGGWDESQVSREGEQINAMRGQCSECLCRDICLIASTDRNVHGGHTSGLRACECTGSRAVADDERDAHVRRIGEPIQQGLQIGAAAGREHGQPHAHARPPP